MGVPSTEITVKYLIEYILDTVYNNPDKWLPQIFGDLKLPEHEALYGNRMIDSAKNWINTTKITTIMGYDLSEATLPSVTVNLQSSIPVQTYMGDFSYDSENAIEDYQRDVIVPAFQLESSEYSSDRSLIYITLKPDMSKPEYVLPGLNLRDKNGKSFLIGFDDSVNKLSLSKISTSLEEIDLSSAVEVISPYTTKLARNGAMSFDETIVIDLHAHQHRNELYLLNSIIMWGLLKYRPLLISHFNLDLSLPMGQDLQVDASYLGNTVFVRRITMKSRAIYEWESNEVDDLVGFLLFTHPGRAQS